MLAVDANLSNKSSVPEKFQIPDHLPTLSQKLWQAFEDQQLCDITLIAGDDGTRVSAHRLILSMACDYFAAMFNGSHRESSETEITLHDIPGTALKCLIQFCYTGAIEVSGENVEIILENASIFQMSSVVTACCDFLAKQLHPSNCLGVALFADHQSFTELSEIAWTYICNHFMSVYKNEEFLKLTEIHLAKILNNGDLSVQSEEHVFLALEAWINQNTVARQKYIAELLGYVRLPLLKQKFLTEHVQPLCKLILDPDSLVKCQQMLIDAFKYHSGPPLSTQIVQARKSEPTRLLVIGGSSNNTFDIEIYDPLINSWRLLDKCPTKERQLSCSGIAVMEEKLIIVGGRDGLKTSSSVECIDLKKMTVSLLPSMNVCRSNLSVTVVDNILYSIGGHDDRAYKRSVERYDPTTCTWNYVAAMNVARGGSGIAVIGNKIYMIGGCDKINTSHSSVECYDIKLDVWQRCASMNKKRYGAGVGVVNGLIYVIGGRNLAKGDRILSVERYDPQINKWSILTSISDPIYNMGVCVLKDKLFVVGGCDLESVKKNEVQQYNPEKDRWTTLSPMNVCRSSINVVAVSELCINQY